MTTRKPLGIGMLLGLFILAFAAMPAMASAVTFVTEAEEEIEANAPLEAESTNLVFTTSNGVQLQCAKSTLSGEITQISPGAAFFQKAMFEGAGGGACATNVAGLTADVTAGAGWTLSLTATGDVWDLTNTVRITATTTFGGMSNSHCTYERASGVVGTYTTATPTTLTIGSGQTFATAAGSSPSCGTGGTLTGSFSLSSNGGAVGIK